MRLDQKIVIVDYGVGNTHSVFKAISVLGYHRVKLSDKESVINDADVLLLPGVGAFDEAVRNLKSRDLIEILNEQVLVKKKPILGICVGLQLFATFSEENGFHEGLGWIEGAVKKLDLEEGFAVPHVGWNNVILAEKQPLFTGNSDNSNFYFDHSYAMECVDEHVAAYCDYGKKITAAVQKENIFGVQFHPEKSQTNGLKLFRSFFNSIQ